MADERHRFMLISKAANIAASTGKFDEGLKKIKDLTSGSFDPADHQEPGYYTMGARIKAGQESKSKRMNIDRKPKPKKEREEETGTDRQERSGKTRKGRKV